MRHHTRRGKDIDTAAFVRRIGTPRNEWIIFGGRGIAVNDTFTHTLGNYGNAENRTPVVVEPDNITGFDAAQAGIYRIESGRPPGIAVFFDPVGWNIVEPVGVFVIMTVEGKPWMRGK